jgi:hypothetical protein
MINFKLKINPYYEILIQKKLLVVALTVVYPY